LMKIYINLIYLTKFIQFLAAIHGGN
jgi:hypothetical protein